MDRRWLALGFLSLVVGCTRKPEPAASNSDPADVPIVTDSPSKYKEPFTKAVTEEIGPDQEPPVERTIAGKSTANLRSEIERIWDSIKLVDENDKPLGWVVTLETDAGRIEIALRPEWAPNHVRNLIALVKIGFYDGLRFDRIVNQQVMSPDGLKSEIHLVRFGCPAGTGDPGIGHIGYRIRSEFSEDKHAIGTVGFTRDADPNSGGTRLYITLAPAPALDGNYSMVGKVVSGLHTVEKIAAGKTLPNESEVPERPTVIRKATVSTLP